MLEVRIKLVRIHLSAILNFIKLFDITREKNLAITCIERARMFLGEKLKELSPETNPYQKVSDLNNANVEPPVDIVSENIYLPLAIPSQTKRIKVARMLLEVQISEVKDIMNKTYFGCYPKNFRHESHHETYSVIISSLIEARMWIGMAMANLHTVAENEPTVARGLDTCDGVNTCDTRKRFLG